MEGVTLDSSVNSVIDNLCMKLGTTAEKLITELAAYEIASAKAIIIISSIVIAIFVIVAVFIFLRFKDTEDDDLVDILIPIFVLDMIAIGISLIVLLINIYNYIVWSSAPTGAAIELILSKIGGS